jgi:hypothetical protein
MADMRTRCPRCGYDQRGVIAQWMDACPLHTVCTECGLEIDWPEQLSGKLRAPEWCVEYARPRRTIPLRCWTTMWRSRRPWRFWSSLKMSNQPRLHRLLLYVLALAAATYLAFAIGQGIFAWRFWSRSAVTAVTPVQIVGARPMPRPPKPLAAAAHALLLPYTTNRLGGSQTVAGIQAGRTGRMIAVTGNWGSPRFNLQVRLSRGPWGWWQRRPLQKLLTLPLALGTILPLVFVTVPASLRRCRVRWIHVLRIWVYSLPLLLLPLWVTLLAYSSGMPMGFPSMRQLAAVSIVVMPLLLMSWWAAALSRHLRMPQPWAVSFCFVVIASGVVLLAGYKELVLRIIMFDWGGHWFV